METNDFGERALMKYYAAGLKPSVEKVKEELLGFVSSAIDECVKEYSAKIEASVKAIMKARYGVDFDPEVYKPLVKKHKLSLGYDSKNNFVGIIANNRWLYTPDGRVIGKKGDRFLLETL